MVVPCVPGLSREEPEGEASAAGTASPGGDKLTSWQQDWPREPEVPPPSRAPLGRAPTQCWPLLIAHPYLPICSFNPEREDQSSVWTFSSAGFISEMIVGSSWTLVAYCTVIPEDWIQCCGCCQSNGPDLASGVTDWLHQLDGAHLPGCTEIGGGRINWIGGVTVAFKMWKNHMQHFRPFVQKLM